MLTCMLCVPYRAAPRPSPGEGGAGRANSARRVVGREGDPPGTPASPPPYPGACVDRYTRRPSAVTASRHRRSLSAGGTTARCTTAAPRLSELLRPPNTSRPPVAARRG